MPNLFTHLVDDLDRLTRDRTATDRLTIWQTTDPALAPYSTWVEVQAAAHDRRDPARADRILAALARRASGLDGDPFAARLLLGLLLPGTKAPCRPAVVAARCGRACRRCVRRGLRAHLHVPDRVPAGPDRSQHSGRRP